MSNQVSLFENSQFGSVRVIMRGEDPWFVAKDVAVCLGYARTADAVATHCKKAQAIGVGDLPTPENSGSPVLDPQTKIIPESDLYRLIMRSHLPNAEAFQDWVVEEVLPQIRKTGKYSQPKSRLEELEEMVMIEKERIAAEQKARAELEARLRAEERSNNLVKRLNGMMSEFSLLGRPLISSDDPYYSHFVTIGEVFENSVKDRSVPVGVKITLGKMLVKFVDQLRAEEGDDYHFTSPNTEHLFEPFHLRNWIRTGYPTGLGQQMIWIVGAELFT